MPDAPLNGVLVDRLRATVDDPRERAALELLVWHETWINRLAVGLGDGKFLGQHGKDAWIQWADLWHHAQEPNPYSSTELRVLALATALAVGAPVNLHDVLSDSVGPATRRAMVAAFSAAAGGLNT